MDERMEIIEKVINKWCGLLKIDRKLFIMHKDSQTGHHVIGFKDNIVSRLVFGDFCSTKMNINCVLMDVEGVPIQFLEKDLDDWLLKKSLYIYAWSNEELISIEDITEADQFLFVKVNSWIHCGMNNKLLELLEKWKRTKNGNIYKIGKKSLLAHYMFIK